MTFMDVFSLFGTILRLLKKPVTSKESREQVDQTTERRHNRYIWTA
jgi:hypothetical protein